MRSTQLRASQLSISDRNASKRSSREETKLGMRADLVDVSAVYLFACLRLFNHSCRLPSADRECSVSAAEEGQDLAVRVARSVAGLTVTPSCNVQPLVIVVRS